MQPHGDDNAPHGPEASCTWCAPKKPTTSEHRRVIIQLEDNLNALRAELHRKDIELGQLQETVQAYEDLLDKPSILDRIETRETIANLEAELGWYKRAYSDAIEALRA